ncbi:xanthine dehydrogenase family protein molybdopterin-binding subunit [Prosthecomicrobium sp. N25]|uniref:xanthine dehydrogenase family protein molybdopterin-binding subunit n=1 Tax=Prosthecomicrobium sp. N25 TaxID=3129254 RepID=UPI0030772F44
MTRTDDVATASVTNVSRRCVLKGLVAGTFVLAATVLPRSGSAADDPPKFGADGMPNGVSRNPHVFLAISGDGTVTITCARSEMGQGVRTGIPLILADELEADWSRVKVSQAPGDEPTYGNQDTDGSRSTRHFFKPMREAGAAGRLMLEAAAARRWGVPIAEVEATNHQVLHWTSGRALGYGDLARDLVDMDVPPADRIRLKKPSEFRYIGKDGRRIVDAMDITTGKAVYGQDVVMPGMVFAVIARPPVLGGKVASFDASLARKVPGVKNVVAIDGASPPVAFLPSGGIAIVADTTWAAMKGRDALKVTWDDGPHAVYDSKTYREELAASARRPGTVVRAEGDLDAALEKASRRVEAEYYIPHLAHATMETPSATALVKDGRCEVWTSVQSPQAARDLVAKTLGLDTAAVKVNVTLLGGGFGRKSKPDFAVEAAILANSMPGTPVKVVWSREDDIRNGFYHTVSLERLRAGIDQTGAVTAWHHNTTAPSIVSLFDADPKRLVPFELGMGFSDTPFDVPNLKLENGAAEAHTKVGWFRSVNNISHAFAIQSFAAELAAAAGRDPRDFLLDLIGPPRLLPIEKEVADWWNYGEDPAVYTVDTGRLRRVLLEATTKAGWGRTLPNGHGLGLAVHRSFVSYIATVVEVAVDKNGQVSVPRVDVAVDCGFAVNPDRIRSQIEGACVMGHSLAMFGEITFEAGRVQQGNFDDYQIARMADAPRETRVHLVSQDFDVPPGGIGEPGVPPYAPALANAIFAATGKRIRSLPIGTQLKA